MISLSLSKLIKLDNRAKVLSFCYMLRKRQFIINGDPKQPFMFTILINMTLRLICLIWHLSAFAFIAFSVNH